MFPYCTDYTWKEGLPYPKDDVDPSKEQTTYRIVHDPYHKRITIERYTNGRFDCVGYDSALLDFRHLSEATQTAWRQKVEEERTLLYDEHDRLLLIETYQFDQGRCIICQLAAPQGIPIGQQRLYYEDRKDPFSGVVLSDLFLKPVLLKRYALSSDGEFTTLLEERWDLLGDEYAKSDHQ